MMPASAASRGPAQRRFLAGIGDDGGRGLHLLGARDEAVVFRGRRRAERADCRKRSDLTVAVAKHVHSFAPIAFCRIVMMRAPEVPFAICRKGVGAGVALGIDAE